MVVRGKTKKAQHSTNY